MPKPPDLAKRELWRKRLQQFERGDQRIVDFCRGLQVPVWSFYYWQQRLRSVANRAAPETQRNGTEKPHRQARFAHRTRSAQMKARLKFVPIQVTGGRNVEVHLANGTCVTIPCQECDAIGAVIAALVSNSPEQRAC